MSNNRRTNEGYCFDCWFMYGFISHDVVWMRIKWINCGVAFKKTPLLFSERMKITKYIPLPKGWRMVYLRGGK